jgi:pimeloyl-ACP methyl ester carboxylesterase
MRTIVVVHGAWSGGWAWRRVKEQLGRHGIETHTPTLTGVGERAHLAHPAVDLALHIQDITAVLEYEDLEEVILLGHSYGGMVITGVADRLPERIAHLVYLDAFVPTHGSAAFDLLPPDLAKDMRALAVSEGNGWRLPPSQPPADTSDADLAWITSRRVAQPMRTFNQKLELKGGEPQHPRTYIYCRRIGAFDTFGRFAQQAAKDSAWQYHELDASHAPNITAPEALAALLIPLATDSA